MAGGSGADDVARVQDSVRAGGLLETDRPLVAMLSGGRDSVCLLDVAVALRGARAVSALHVNYGLREGADADEQHCARICEGLGVELLLARRQRASAAAGDEEDAGGNLQAWAREVRYREASQLAGQRGALI